jgi:hypothetical protein
VTEDDGHNGRPAAAASRCATLRLLRADLPCDHGLYASALQGDLEVMLENKQIDKPTLRAAVDLFLISDVWLPSEDETQRLIRTIASDLAALLRDGSDPLLGAGQAALWLTATMASRCSSAEG